MKTFSNLWLSSWILLRMRNFSNNSCRENQNKHFMFNNVFPENRAVYDTVEKFGGARGAINDVTVWRKRVVWWISKATRTDRHCHAHVLRHTHGRVLTHTNKYITLIAFPLQQWFANAPQYYVIRTSSYSFSMHVLPAISSSIFLQVYKFWCPSLCSFLSFN